MQLVLGQRWPTFEAYLASLTSKPRNSVRRTLREVEQAGYACRPLSLEALSEAEPRIDDLYAQVWANADLRPVRLSGRFFVELKRHLGDACKVMALERAGRIDAFAVALRNQRTATAYYLGFERSVEAPLYLRLLLAMIETGISWCVDSISLGRTAEEPKARLGAEAVNGFIWAKHRTPPLNWAVGAVLGSLATPAAPNHRVFRHTET